MMAFRGRWDESQHGAPTLLSSPAACGSVHLDAKASGGRGAPVQWRNERTQISN